MKKAAKILSFVWYLGPLLSYIFLSSLVEFAENMISYYHGHQYDHFSFHYNSNTMYKDKKDKNLKSNDNLHGPTLRPTFMKGNLFPFNNMEDDSPFYGEKFYKDELFKSWSCCNLLIS